MKLSKIEREFENVAFRFGGVFLLRPVDALRFVDEHRKSGIPILGIDGFMVYDMRQVQPMQEHGADFDTEGTKSHDQAEDFILERFDLGIWFEVVPDKWQSGENHQVTFWQYVRWRMARIAKATFLHLVLSVSLFGYSLGRQMHLFHGDPARPGDALAETVANLLMSPIALPALTQQEFAYLTTTDQYLAIGLNSLVWGLFFSWLVEQFWEMPRRSRS